jgi:hypothetical protein
MNYGYLVYIPILALVIGYTVFMRQRAAKAAVTSRPAAVAFFERTGYFYADRPNMPAEVQADRAALEMTQMTALGAQQMAKKDYEHVTHQIRNYHGVMIHYRSAFGGKFETLKTTTYRSASWAAELTRPPRVPVHIADKSLVSMTKAVGEMFTNTRRQFTPQASQRVETGIAAIDGKFAVFGEDVAATRALFAQHPDLVEMLGNWAALDVFINAGGCVFNDPGQENVQAAMGGMVGNMALGFDIAKRLELMIPVHDRVSDLLLTLIRATA